MKIKGKLKLQKNQILTFPTIKKEVNQYNKCNKNGKLRKKKNTYLTRTNAKLIIRKEYWSDLGRSNE